MSRTKRWCELTPVLTAPIVDCPGAPCFYPVTVAKPTKRFFPFRVELSAEDFHSLRKGARRQSPVARRLIAADDATDATGSVVVTGSAAEGLALRALGVAVAPKAVPVIDRALKVAEGSKAAP
jgi:hypothetical protein